MGDSDPLAARNPRCRLRMRMPHLVAPSACGRFGCACGWGAGDGDDDDDGDGDDGFWVAGDEEGSFWAVLAGCVGAGGRYVDVELR